MVPEPFAGGWAVDALARTSDIVLILDATTAIVWANPASYEQLGHAPHDLIGRSIAEYVHPEDLERAAEVVGLIAEGRFENKPVTPALYRVRDVKGRWISYEVNASRSCPEDDFMLLIGRFAGDLTFADRLLEAVTADMGFEYQVNLVLQMGRWRYPEEGYAIIYRDHGEVRRVGHDLRPELFGAVTLDDPSPWDQAMGTGVDVTVASVNDSGAVDVLSPALAKAAREAGYRGCLAAPVADPAHPEGACIVIWSTESGPSLAGHRYAVDNMRRALALVLQQRAQVLALERAAHVDALTGLIARARFFDLLDQADGQSRGQGHTLLFIDLDGFKKVNDQIGHAAGDAVLRVAAERIASAAPRGASVGRLGGDEFGLLCPPSYSAASASRLAQQVIETVSEPVDVGRTESVAVGASVGVAVGGPGEAASDVLDRADRALLLAKSAGRGRWNVMGPHGPA